MIVLRVIRAEGVRSAGRRAVERIQETARLAALLARGLRRRRESIPVLNVSPTAPSPRLGGIQAQLVARLRRERELRKVALLYPGILELPGAARRVAQGFDGALGEAVAITGARTIHLEGTFGAPVEALLRLHDAGLRVVVSVHDFSLLSNDPHELTFDPDRAALARRLLERATAVFPSAFLRDRFRELLGLPLERAAIIEPGIEAGSLPDRVSPARRRIAFAGSVRRHKGGHLLPELIRACDPNVEWHIFGGGDPDLLRPLRRLPRVLLHGYYRAGTLPALLVRHAIDLAVLPSIVPETFGLALSECWAAGVPAVAFAHGALAARIRVHGGGWGVPPGEGVAGIASVIQRWRSGELTTSVTPYVPTAAAAAAAHVELYARSDR